MFISNKMKEEICWGLGVIISIAIIAGMILTALAPIIFIIELIVGV